MSTNKTPNLNLHSWVETDPVLMSEFNENFNALDAASQMGVKVVCGTYVGDGTKSKTLFFPATPKFVLARQTDYSGIFNSIWLLASSNLSYVYKDSSASAALNANVAWDDNSVTWSTDYTLDYACDYIRNKANTNFHYIAICV